MIYVTFCRMSDISFANQLSRPAEIVGQQKAEMSPPQKCGAKQDQEKPWQNGRQFEHTDDNPQMGLARSETIAPRYLMPVLGYSAPLTRDCGAQYSLSEE